MADILSQDEINALLSALPTDEPTATGTVTGEKVKHVKVYDFRHPDKLSKVQLHVLQIIHENMARILSTSFSVQLRAATHFSVIAVEQKTYEEFTRSIPNPTTLLVFRMEPYEGNAVWEMSPSATFLMFDRLLGGNGAVVDEERELTEIERTVIKRVAQRLLSALKDSWHAIADFNPVLESIENNPEFTQIVSPTEVVMVVTIDITIGDSPASMNICVPYLLLKPVSSLLSTQVWYSTGIKQKTPTEKDTKAITANLSLSSLPVSVELGKARIKIRDFIELKPGDALKLDRSVKDDLVASVFDIPKFTGKPGLTNKKYSFKVTSVNQREGD
jgi:flagellar motor switch protein FliM